MLNAMLGAVSQGLLWGVMVLGVYITFKLLDIADLTVDGSFATGGAVCAVLVVAGVDPLVAILAAMAAGAVCGAVTGFLTTVLKIPAILAGILTQISLWSI
ncbi:MAG: ABC transporter permease, partial [Olegusella sp.]|nr:ABC transporter permease [Olegusella sp.]